MDKDRKIISDYYKLIEIPMKKAETQMDEDNSSKEIPENLEKAFEFANSCRDKEIDRFWTRGLYFWGFIVASFTAYLAVFSLSLGDDAVNLKNILGMSFTAKCVLFVISFVCFIFCLSWLLVHKGSKYWQQNWESHVSYLEADYIGKIYNVYLNKDDKTKFSKCLFSPKGYGFSVSKVSMLCSLLLAIVSLVLLLFNVVLLLKEIELICLPDCKKVIVIILILLAVAFFLFYWNKSVGNKNENADAKFSKHELETIYGE